MEFCGVNDDDCGSSEDGCDGVSIWCESRSTIALTDSDDSVVVSIIGALKKKRNIKLVFTRKIKSFGILMPTFFFTFFAL